MPGVIATKEQQVVVKTEREESSSDNKLSKIPIVSIKVKDRKIPKPKPATCNFKKCNNRKLKTKHCCCQNSENELNISTDSSCSECTETSSSSFSDSSEECSCSETYSESSDTDCSEDWTTDSEHSVIETSTDYDDDTNDTYEDESDSPIER